MALSLVFLTVLSACSGDSGTHISNSEGSGSVCEAGTDKSASSSYDEGKNEVTDKAISAYQSILLGEESYYDAASDEPLSINQICDLGDVQNAEPQRFTIQDLDGDAMTEAVIQMGANGIDDFGTLILHFEDTQVTGYFMWPRAFGDLKADGTFSSSSGAFDHGYSRIDFSAFNAMADAPSNTIIHQICYCTSSAGHDKAGALIEKYYNDSVEITAEEFDKEQQKQSAKEDASWIDFTPDNINDSITLLQSPSDNQQ